MNEREAGAMKIVYKYIALSAGAALIPVPVLDVAVLAGVHISLIKQISEYYGVEFSEHSARNILVAIAATLIPGSISSIASRRALSVASLFTHTLGAAGMSLFSAGVSYGLGKIFIRHFESGGTLLDFDAKHVKNVFSHFVQGIAH